MLNIYVDLGDINPPLQQHFPCLISSLESCGASAGLELSDVEEGMFLDLELSCGLFAQGGRKV